jgi:hypothetical protein
MGNDTPERGNERSGLSRREMIKRAGIVGGVVAWTAPTIQMLGQNTAWAASKKIKPGSVTICNGAKPGRVRYIWQGSSSGGGSCTDHPNTCAANCACTDSPTQGTYSCGTGDVYITLTSGQGTIDQSSVTGGTWDNSQQVHGGPGLTFDVIVNGNNEVFTVRTGSHAGTICQSVQFHVSCSQTPPVMPGYQLGGVLLFDWSAS